MKKVIFRVELYDEKIKKKVMRAVSSCSGVCSISMDMVSGQFTVIGDIDPVYIVSKLRKLCSADIISVGPAKEPKKKKDEPKKLCSTDIIYVGPAKGPEKKKEEPKKADDKKKEELTERWKAYHNKPGDKRKEELAELWKAYHNQS